MRKRGTSAILMSFTVLILASLACSQVVSATSTPVPTATARPTATPLPTATPTLAPTPTMSTAEICESEESGNYIQRSNAIWSLFLAVDQAVGQNIADDGRLKSTKGFTEFTKVISDLEKEQDALTPPSIFLDYNRLAITLFQSYKLFLDDALDSKSETVLQIDALQAVDNLKAANLEWAKVGEACGWPTPPPPSQTG